MRRSGMNTEGRESFSVAGMSVLALLYLLFGYVAWASPSPIQPYMPWAWFLPPAVTLSFTGGAEAYISIENAEDFSKVTGIPLGSRA